MLLASTAAGSGGAAQPIIVRSPKRKEPRQALALPRLREARGGNRSADELGRYDWGSLVVEIKPEVVSFFAIQASHVVVGILVPPLAELAGVLTQTAPRVTRSERPSKLPTSGLANAIEWRDPWRDPGHEHSIVRRYATLRFKERCRHHNGRENSNRY